MPQQAEHYSQLRQTDIPQKPSDELTSLLLKQPYRDMWGQFIQRRRGDGINIRAVATFMAYELSDNAGKELSPDQFKDSVRRALKENNITDRTINRFAAAFGFTPGETQALWQSVVYQRTHSQMRAAAQARQGTGTDRTVLSKTIILHCDEVGFTRSIEILESFRVEQDEIHHFTTYVEGHSLEPEVVSGGEILNVSKATNQAFAGSANDVLAVEIKPPYLLKRGEIHHYRFRCNLHEDLDDGAIYNRFRIGAANDPRYNVTVIVRFPTPREYFKHCVWDRMEFEHPLLEENMTSGLSHYSAFYPIVYKAYCGFQWAFVISES